MPRFGKAVDTVQNALRVRFIENACRIVAADVPVRVVIIDSALLDGEEKQHMTLVRKQLVVGVGHEFVYLPVIGVICIAVHLAEQNNALNARKLVKSVERVRQLVVIFVRIDIVVVDNYLL